MRLAVIALLISGAAIAQTSDLYWETYLDANTFGYLIDKRTFAHADGSISYAETWEAAYSNKWGTTYSDETHIWRVSKESNVIMHRVFSSGAGTEFAEDPNGNLIVDVKAYYDGNSAGGSPALIKLSPSGQTIWEVPLTDDPRGLVRIAVDDNGNSYSAYYFYSNVLLRSYDAAGNLRFDAEFPGLRFDSLVNLLRYDSNVGVALYGSDTSNIPSVYRISETGQLLDSLEGLNIQSPRSAFGPNLTVYRGLGTTLTCFDWDGNVQWSHNFPTDIVTVQSDDDHVYVTTSTQAIFMSHQGAVQRTSSLSSAPLWAGFDGLGSLGVRIADSLTKVGLNLGLYSIHNPGNAQPLYTFGKHSDWFEVVRAPFGGTRIRRFRSGVEHHVAQIIRGNSVENSHQALFYSSDGYWGLGPGVTFTTSQAPISIVMKHVAPNEGPSEMAFVIESRGTSTAVAQTVDAYNFATGSWTNLETNVSLPAGASADRYAVLDVANPEDHIGPNREVRVRVEYRAVGPVFAYPWRARIDRQMLHYVKE